MFHNLDVIWLEIMMLINDCHHKQVSKMIGHYWSFSLRDIPFALCNSY